MAISTILSNLADEIYLVGIKAIYNSKHTWVKIFWIFFIIAGSSATCYYIMKTVQEFNEDRTVMKVEFYLSTLYDYPNIAVCEKEWIDEKKLQQFNISWNVIFYALSFARPISTFEYVSRNVSPESGKIEYDKFVSERNIENLFEFYSFIAKDSTLILEYCFGKEQCQTSSKMVFMMEKICYIPNLPQVDCDLQTASGPPVIVVHRQNYSIDNNSRNGDLIINPEYRVYKVYEETIPLFQGTKIAIKMVPKKFVLLNKVDKYSCVENDTYSQFVCHHHCMEEEVSLKYLNCGRLTYFAERPYLFQSKAPCNISFLLENEVTHLHSLQEELAHICSKRCLPSCTKLIYQVSIITKSLPPYSDTNNGDSVVEIIYDVCASGIETVQEYYGYSVETLIANIGGVLGLWVGASAVTFVQIFLFIVQAVFSTLKERKKFLVRYEEKSVETAGV